MFMKLVSTSAIGGYLTGGNRPVKIGGDLTDGEG